LVQNEERAENREMSPGKKIAATIVSILFALVLVIAYWAFLYDGDLPDFQHLAEFAPSAPMTISNDECLGESLDLIPTDEMGDAFRKAFPAAEAPETWTNQIARSALCDRAERSLGAHVVAEWRMIWRLKRAFSHDQLLAIYANRAYFGDRALGVNEASMHFMQKRPKDLTLDEAALLAGLLRAPEAYFPSTHPDRALARRNAVLREMVRQASLSAAEAAELETRPIPKPAGKLQRRLPFGGGDFGNL
jgi:membrane carboxypeptidase/penicillin-binding protein